MTNPPKQKGTSGETELLRLFHNVGGWVFEGTVRAPASAGVDLILPQESGFPSTPLEVLATRPDRGRWLVTMNVFDFIDLFTAADLYVERPLHVEVKRYKRFSLHTIFEGKFGRHSALH